MSSKQICVMLREEKQMLALTAPFHFTVHYACPHCLTHWCLGALTMHLMGWAKPKHFQWPFILLYWPQADLPRDSNARSRDTKLRLQRTVTELLISPFVHAWAGSDQRMNVFLCFSWLVLFQEARACLILLFGRLYIVLHC